MKKPVSNRQFLDTEILLLEVDGSEVTTSAASTGLGRGQHQCNIKKGASADSNLITITFKKPIFGAAPSVFIQEKTLDCVARLETAATATTIQIRTLELDGTTAEDDADLSIMLVGPTYNKEGNY